MKLQVKYFRGVIFVCEGVSHDCGVKLVYTQIKLSCKFGFLHWEKKLNEMSTNRYEDIPNCQTLIILQNSIPTFYKRNHVEYIL